MNRRGDRILGRRAHGGVLLVPCLLNDVYRYWFLADTGAAISMVSPAVAQELRLDISHPVRQERIASVHQIVRVPVVRLQSLQLGSQKVSDLDVLVFSLPSELRVDGLLGVNMLENFRATFEFTRSALILR
jgi:predicted aspartyl protease